MSTPIIPTAEVIIHPVCLRFRWENDELIYFFASNPEQQLDEMEKMMSVKPGDIPIFMTNVGFLPVVSTVLVRGEKNLLIDPGNHFIGAYAMLWHALQSRGLDYDDIDMFVTTHTHSDHAGSIVQLAGKPWIIGKGELAEMALIEGQPIVDAKVSMMSEVIEIEENTEIMPGVTIVPTPGHTAGHQSVMIDTATDRVIVTGDQTMLKSEWVDRKFSHWYGDEQLAKLNAALDKLQALEPDLIIPSHDRPFRPKHYLA